MPPWTCRHQSSSDERATGRDRDRVAWKRPEVGGEPSGLKATVGRRPSRDERAVLSLTFNPWSSVESSGGTGAFTVTGPTPCPPPIDRPSCSQALVPAAGGIGCDCWKDHSGMDTQRAHDRIHGHGARPRALAAAFILSLLLAMVGTPLEGVAAAPANQATWTQLSPATSPPARDYSSIAFDPATGQLILFGGDSHSGLLGDTWAWTGGTWTQLTPPPAHRPGLAPAWPSTPRPASSSSSAVPAAVVVLGDTWAWTGSTWTKLNSGHQPAGAGSRQPGLRSRDRPDDPLRWWA